MTSDGDKILTEDEGKAIVRAALSAAAGEGQSEDDLMEVIAWAEQTRIHAWALEDVLAGKMGAFMRDGEVILPAEPA